MNVAAVPVGVSNGFMVAEAGHPFLAQMISALRIYDRSYFGIPCTSLFPSLRPPASHS